MGDDVEFSLGFNVEEDEDQDDYVIPQDDEDDLGLGGDDEGEEEMNRADSGASFIENDFERDDIGPADDNPEEDVGFEKADYDAPLNHDEDYQDDTYSYEDFGGDSPEDTPRSNASDEDD
eukprot:NODE_4510_length_654_cov_42.047934_g3858_i0.p1 GENE.NODE_4510_length_654_cov_42.047934_g3858_i0~~NODE_4510_length_654_cov_42.047934_g3858_i0.p1  ORF type:complete len:120 (-),score=42.43 NODE_4510_length_654_cov_42.047934_g3858_i0:195-554(-)